MRTAYQVGALWIGGALRYLEQLCLKSFVDAGQHVVLYSYEPIGNVPEGVERADAASVLPRTGLLRHSRTVSPALFSGLFRYHMLARGDRMIWADTDAFCLRPFTSESGHFYAWESRKIVNGGVLGMPKDSATLQALLEFTSDPCAVPAWYAPQYLLELEIAAAKGEPVRAADLPWGVWGPHALTHVLAKTGEIARAMPVHTHYPVSFRNRNAMVRAREDLSAHLREDTYSIRFYGRRMRARLAACPDGVPRFKSLSGQLLAKHRIDPRAVPILRKPRPVPAVQQEELAAAA